MVAMVAVLTTALPIIMIFSLKNKDSGWLEAKLQVPGGYCTENGVHFGTMDCFLYMYMHIRVCTYM